MAAHIQCTSMNNLKNDWKSKLIVFIIVSFLHPVGDDYQLVVIELKFATGEKRKEVSVSMVDDNVIENMESFQLLLSITSDIISKGVQLGPNATATVTIKDNDGELIELCTRKCVYCT